MDDAFEIEIGDLVQVEIMGVLQLPEPATVLDIQEHGDDVWVLTDASLSWVRLDQIVPTTT